MTHNMFSHSKTAPSLNRTKNKELKKYKYIFFLFTSRFSERIIALKLSTTNPHPPGHKICKNFKYKIVQKYWKIQETQKHKICYVCTCEWQGMVIPPSGHMICTAPIRITALSSPIMGYSNLPSYNNCPVQIRIQI